MFDDGHEGSGQRLGLRFRRGGGPRARKWMEKLLDKAREHEENLR